MSTVRSAAAVLVCVVLAQAAYAQRDEEEGAPSRWVEEEIKLPPFPKPDSLIQFEASGASSNQSFIDADSISTGKDGVVRYTLVIKGQSGGQNVSYEGIRCETREQKYYASGRPDGRWMNARAPQWKRIEYRELNRQHWVLYADYFCSDRKYTRAPKDVIQRLRFGAPRTD
jgi:hypothetical protein